MVILRLLARETIPVSVVGIECEFTGDVVLAISTGPLDCRTTTHAFYRAIPIVSEIVPFITCVVNVYFWVKRTKCHG